MDRPERTMPRLQKKLHVWTQREERRTQLEPLPKGSIDSRLCLIAGLLSISSKATRRGLPLQPSTHGWNQQMGVCFGYPLFVSTNGRVSFGAGTLVFVALNGSPKNHNHTLFGGPTLTQAHPNGSLRDIQPQPRILSQHILNMSIGTVVASGLWWCGRWSNSGSRETPWELPIQVMG